MAVALVQHQGRGLSFELGGKRTSLLAHQAPLSRQGFSPKSVSGISRPLHKIPVEKAAGLVHIPKNATYRIDIDDRESQKIFFRRASYICKAATKQYGNGQHGFGCSRC
ncbi:TPA: YagK/YfjJ domain-containing protein [Pseudomonas aeruginosa]